MPATMSAEGITRLISQVVVVVFEAVEVYEEQPEYDLALGALLHSHWQAIEERSAIGQPREGIAMGHLGEPRLELLVFGDITSNAE